MNLFPVSWLLHLVGYTLGHLSRNSLNSNQLCKYFVNDELLTVNKYSYKFNYLLNFLKYHLIVFVPEISSLLFTVSFHSKQTLNT